MDQVSTTSRKQKMLSISKIISKKPRAISLAAIFCLIAIFASTAVNAQSARRGLSAKRTQSLAMKHYLKNLPLEDIDLYVGKVIRKDGEYVIVKIMSPNVVKDRIPMYYACDNQMSPTAILENINISHRSCATFKTQSGTALVGDTVMVKYFAPEEEK